MLTAHTPAGRYPRQAMRAVNQALGRVIRHRNDYGAVLLCDERFAGQGTRQQLSKWLRDKVATPPTFGAAAATLQKFFRVRHAAPLRQHGADRGLP